MYLEGKYSRSQTGFLTRIGLIRRGFKRFNRREPGTAFSKDEITALSAIFQLLNWAR